VRLVYKVELDYKVFKVQQVLVSLCKVRLLLKAIFLLLETLRVMLILFKLMIAYTCGMVLHGLTVVLFKDLKVFKGLKDKPDYKAYKVLLVSKALKVLLVSKVVLVFKELKALKAK